MGLFIKKPLGALQAEANESGSKTLKRVLGPWSLVALGVGCLLYTSQPTREVLLSLCFRVISINMTFH